MFGDRRRGRSSQLPATVMPRPFLEGLLSRPQGLLAILCTEERIRRPWPMTDIAMSCSTLVCIGSCSLEAHMLMETTIQTLRSSTHPADHININAWILFEGFARLLWYSSCCDRTPLPAVQLAVYKKGTLCHLRTLPSFST